MPYRHPEPEDPQVHVGVSVPGDEESMRELAYAFAEEFAMMGHPREWILRMFANPFYAGAHRAQRELGDAEIERIVSETADLWTRVRMVDHDPPAGGGPNRWEV
jgi:hypothetical protein